jgi:hypothetical protein
MRQSCAVDLVGLDVCDRAFGGFGTERSKPVRGLVGGVHLLLIFPQAHREHLAAIRVGEEQAATVTILDPKRRYDVFFDRTVPLLQAFRAYSVLGYPREHGTTAFLA